MNYAKKTLTRGKVTIVIWGDYARCKDSIAIKKVRLLRVGEERNRIYHCKIIFTQFIELFHL
jgi:hypothetical protein